MVTNENPPANPYGGVPGGGITLPPYYKPTPSMKSATTYFPTAEELGADEMRISFVGSCPFPPRADQAATCIMVELGNGKRFFFDFGPGCLRNIIAMQVPLQMINDIFITHLHVDHFGELPYLYCFAPWAARWKPLRVTGPSGRTPEDGTSYMLEQMPEDAALAHRQLQLQPDRGRLRGRRHRIRLPRRQQNLLRPGRRHHPALAALTHQGRRIGPGTPRSS